MKFLLLESVFRERGREGEGACGGVAWLNQFMFTNLHIRVMRHQKSEVRHIYHYILRVPLIIRIEDKNAISKECCTYLPHPLIAKGLQVSKILELLKLLP